MDKTYRLIILIICSLVFLYFIASFLCYRFFSGLHKNDFVCKNCGSKDTLERRFYEETVGTWVHVCFCRDCKKEFRTRTSGVLPKRRKNV